MAKEINRTEKLGTRKRFTVPDPMRHGWEEGDLLQFTQPLDEPYKVIVTNVDLEERRKTQRIVSE